MFAYLPLSGEKVTGALGSKAERAAAASRLHGAIVFGREGNTPVITVWQFRLENIAAADAEPQVVTPVLGRAAAAAMSDAFRRPCAHACIPSPLSFDLAWQMWR